jgi:hypothetical protein
MIDPFYETSLWLIVILGWAITITNNIELREQLIELKQNENRSN